MKQAVLEHYRKQNAGSRSYFEKTRTYFWMFSMVDLVDSIHLAHFYGPALTFMDQHMLLFFHHHMKMFFDFFENCFLNYEASKDDLKQVSDHYYGYKLTQSRIQSPLKGYKGSNAKTGGFFLACHVEMGLQIIFHLTTIEILS